jgi:hypothetical protein
LNMKFRKEMTRIYFFKKVSELFLSWIMHSKILLNK